MTVPSKSAPSAVRGLEAGAIAYTLATTGQNFGLAIDLTWGDAVAGVTYPPIGGGCPAPGCPALDSAVTSALATAFAVSGVIHAELLAALMLALRRLAELEDKPVATIVADLITEAEAE